MHVRICLSGNGSDVAYACASIRLHTCVYVCVTMEAALRAHTLAPRTTRCFLVANVSMHIRRDVHLHESNHLWTIHIWVLMCAYTRIPSEMSLLDNGHTSAPLYKGPILAHDTVGLHEDSTLTTKYSMLHI